MASLSTIEWTDRTWNPVRGCSVVSPGCINCYAMKQAHRFSGKGKAYEGLTKQTSGGPQWTGKVREVWTSLLEPLSWKKPQRIFVNSMSDLFHEDVEAAFISEVFGVMRLAWWHTFQILTKRPARMRELLNDPEFQTAIENSEAFNRLPDEHAWEWPLPNIWLGVSAEDQQRADERIPLLLQTPAAVRFVSAEPLIGPIDFESIEWPGGAWNHRVDVIRGGYWNSEGWRGLGPAAQLGDPRGGFTNHSDMATIDWVIVGGESGPGARPCAMEWIEHIVQQCKAASVTCFVKQLGAVVVSEQRTMPKDMASGPVKAADTAPNGEVWAWRAGLAHKKGADPSEWPEDLRVREFPSVEARP